MAQVIESFLLRHQSYRLYLIVETSRCPNIQISKYPVP
ncbi:MAG: hypothetical protein ACI9XO_004360, partial [Paraglaciecola sp.]